MEEDIKILEDFKNNSFQKDKLERNEKGGFKIGTIYKTTELNPAIENLINKYKEQEKMIELMAENIYNTSDTLKMLDIGKEINYDLEKLFNGIDDNEAIKIIIDYFRKKAKGE